MHNRLHRCCMTPRFMILVASCPWWWMSPLYKGCQAHLPLSKMPLLVWDLNHTGPCDFANWLMISSAIFAQHTGVHNMQTVICCYVCCSAGNAAWKLTLEKITFNLLRLYLAFTVLIVLHLNFIFVVTSSYVVVYLLLVKYVSSPCVRIVHRTVMRSMTVEPLHACLFCVCVRE